MTEDIIIAQITDTHIVAKGKHWMGLSKSNTAKRLQSVVNHINQLVPRPDIVIHTGDISDEGRLFNKLCQSHFLPF